MDANKVPEPAPESAPEDAAIGLLLVPGWNCADGTPDEDHDWRMRHGTHMECRQCGKTRDATESEIADSYHDDD